MVSRGRKSGFTITELMVVVATSGVLAAAAVSGYHNYLHRSQLSEATGLLWAAKAPMAEHYANRGHWPAQPGDVVGTISGRYTASIDYHGAPDDSSPGRVALMATLSSFGVAPEIRGTTFLLETADGGAHWTCRSGGTKPIATSYLPGACR